MVGDGGRHGGRAPGRRRARGHTRRRQKRSAEAEQIIGTLAVVPFDIPVAREYARLRAILRAAGVTVGIHDLQIGATALVLGHPVATRDERSFPRIPGLKVEKW